MKTELLFIPKSFIIYLRTIQKGALHERDRSRNQQFFIQLHSDPRITPWIIGGIVAVLVGYCLLGGGQRVVRATSLVVPVMGVAYIAVTLIIVIINIPALLILGKYAFRAVNDYTRKVKSGEKITFLASDIGLPDAVDYWQE